MSVLRTLLPRREGASVSGCASPSATFRVRNIRTLGRLPTQRSVPAEKFGARGVKSTDYKTLLREADVVSFHVSLIPQTRHMLGARELSLMRPSSVLLNTSRGDVVDEAALARALETGQIATAGLDVFEDEPWPWRVRCVVWATGCCCRR